MAYIVKRIPFANGVFADENGNSILDYSAYFEEKHAFKREKYNSMEDALADGCKLITRNHDGQNIFYIVQGVNPDMVSKVWDIPKNEDEAKAVSVIYYYTSPNQKEALQWFSKNLRMVSSRFGINVHLVKFDKERVNENQP